MTDTVKLKHHEIFLRDRLQLQVLEGFLRYSRIAPVSPETSTRPSGEMPLD